MGYWLLIPVPVRRLLPYLGAFLLLMAGVNWKLAKVAQEAVSAEKLRRVAIDSQRHTNTVERITDATSQTHSADTARARLERVREGFRPDR